MRRVVVFTVVVAIEAAAAVAAWAWFEHKLDVAAGADEGRLP